MLVDYDTFRKAVIVVYGNIEQRSNSEDGLGRIKNTGYVAIYISTFNEYAA